MSDQWGQQPSWGPESWGQQLPPNQQPQGLPPVPNQQPWGQPSAPNQPPQRPQSIPNQQSWGQPPIPNQQQWQPQSSPNQQQWGQPLPNAGWQPPPFNPGQFQPPQPPQPPQLPPKKKKNHVWLILGIIVGIMVLGGMVVNLSSKTSNTGTVAQTTTPTTSTKATRGTQAHAQPTATPTPKPTATPTPLPVHYPPTTEADLRNLAAKGDTSAIHEFHSESVGLTGVCSQPKREVTVDSSITGQQLAEDLLAYFYAQQLDNPCGSIVFAYHNQAEVNDPNSIGYTAGRIMLDVTDSSGAINVDPNATNLKYTLTLDVGGLGAGQEYVVTY